MKKIVALIIVWVLTVSVFAGCGSKKTVDSKEGADTPSTSHNNKDKEQGDEVEPLDFAVVLLDADLSPNEIQIYQELEEKTGVKINWQTVPDAGWEEKRSLLFASNNLPDAFFGNFILTDNDVLKYGTQGMLIPLEDYITPEIMPNLSSTFEKYPELKKSVTAPDGHIYGLPSFDNGSVTTTTNVHYINKDWLEAVNMEVPTTTEAFYQVLKAFKENDVNGNGDPNDEIPYSFQKSTNYISDLFGAFGIIDDYKTHIDVQNGKVIFTAADPAYKEAIMFFNRLFKEGLIDQEAFTHDSKAFKAKLKSEERIVGSFQSWRSTGWAIEEGDDSYVPVPPLVGPKGHQLYPERINGVKSKGAFAVSYEAKNPEYIMAWVDHIYEPFFGLQISYALKDGVHIEDKDGDGKYETLVEATTDNRTGVIPQGKVRIDNVTPEASAMLAEKPKHLAEKHMLDAYYNQHYRGEYYPKVFFTLKEVERLSILRTDIVDYSNEMYARWMQVGGIEDDWDSYLDRLNQMGLKELIQIHQDALDRFNN